MNKVFFYTSMATVILAFVMMVVALFWLLYPYKTIEFKPTYAPVITNPVEVGGYVEYELNYCKYTKLDAEIHRSLVDGIIYLTTDGIADVKEGCGIQRIRMYVPRAMAPGKYRVSITREYKVNPIRTIRVQYFTEEFVVL